MSDTRTFRRLCIQMAAAGDGELGDFMSLSVEELMEITQKDAKKEVLRDLWGKTRN